MFKLILFPIFFLSFLGFAQNSYHCVVEYTTIFDVKTQKETANFIIVPDEINEKKIELVKRDSWTLHGKLYIQPGTNDRRVLFLAKFPEQKDQTNLTLDLFAEGVVKHEGTAYHDRKQTAKDGVFKQRKGHLFLSCEKSEVSDESKRANFFQRILIFLKDYFNHKE